MTRQEGAGRGARKVRWELGAGGRGGSDWLAGAAIWRGAGCWVARTGVGDGGRRGAGRLLHPGVVGSGSVVVAIPPWISYLAAMAGLVGTSLLLSLSAPDMH